MRKTIFFVPFLVSLSWGGIAAAQPVGGACSEPGGNLANCILDLKKVIAEGSRKSIGEVANAVAKRLDLEHDKMIADRGCGKFIGTKAGDPPPDIRPAPQRTDCTTFVIDVLREAFAAQGKTAEWNRAFTKAQQTSGPQGFRGTELMKALQGELGWTGIFWSPDTKTEDAGGEHKYAAYVARTKGTYYGMKVDKEKQVVDYRPEDGRAPNTKGMDALKKIPFGVLAAKGGMHMALVLNGKVYEVHWSDGCESMRLIDASELAAWGWNSGAIMVPPGDAAAAFGGS